MSALLLELCGAAQQRNDATGKVQTIDWAISARADMCIDIVGPWYSCEPLVGPRLTMRFNPFDYGLVERSADFAGPHHGNAGDAQVIRAASIFLA
jgi:hypothetical protein